MSLQLGFNQWFTQQDLSQLRDEAKHSGSSSADLSFDGRQYKVYFIVNGSDKGGIEVQRQYSFCQDLFRCVGSLSDFFTRTVQSRSLCKGLETRAKRLERALNAMTQTDTSICINNRLKIESSSVKEKIRSQFTRYMHEFPLRQHELLTLQNQLIDLAEQNLSADHDYTQMMARQAPEDVPIYLHSVGKSPDGSNGISMTLYHELRDQVINALHEQHESTKTDFAQKLAQFWAILSKHLADDPEGIGKDRSGMNLTDHLKELANCAGAKFSSSFKAPGHPLLNAAAQGCQLPIMIRIYVNEFAGEPLGTEPIPLVPKAQSFNSQVSLTSEASKVIDDDGSSEFTANFHRGYRDDLLRGLERRSGQPRVGKAEGVDLKGLTPNNIDQLDELSLLPSAIRYMLVKRRREFLEGRVGINCQDMLLLCKDCLTKLVQKQKRLDMTHIGILAQEVESIPKYYTDVCQREQLPLLSIDNYEMHRKNVLQAASYHAFRANRNRQAAYTKLEEMLTSSEAKDWYQDPFDPNSFLAKVCSYFALLCQSLTDEVPTDQPLDKDNFSKYCQYDPKITLLMHQIYRHEILGSSECWLTQDAKAGAAAIIVNTVPIPQPEPPALKSILRSTTKS